jgi:hypothetical protein
MLLIRVHQSCWFGRLSPPSLGDIANQIRLSHRHAIDLLVSVLLIWVNVVADHSLPAEPTSPRTYRGRIKVFLVLPKNYNDFVTDYTQ